MDGSCREKCCVYTSLILLSGQPWLFYGVCICSFLNPLLSFLPPTLERLDYTGHNEWYIHLPAILLGLIICVIQVLLLLRQIWPGNKSASDTQRSRIICCFVAILEAVAFLVLIGFFFRHKRVYEDLPWILFAMSLLSFRFFPFMEVYRICRGISNGSQPSLEANLAYSSSSSTVSSDSRKTQRWSLSGGSKIDRKMTELWISGKVETSEQQV
ncbi:uncharacterized protein ALTATR162_LOCUS12129 [Alternaria atra]|uniref:Uncharacterized protein n=1 Tax=Alternaria atra TaxID=119953 RepID=A0A8J2IE35_9PLEO|nr:uncharacterized protein ALTATR162_LOCUS12129 [Alternaria atra]CAG5190098.1 unnamed protein product [Alternaria atra]